MEESECDMVSSISFIQTNLQQSIVASRILTRTVSIKVIDMALIQESWHCEDHIRGLIIPGYPLYSASGIYRPRTCILARNMTTWILQEFSLRDLVAGLIKCDEVGAER